jgi:hypothetical protein
LKTNTIVNVAHAAGLYTAWADKHPAYEIANGPSGEGVNDLSRPRSPTTGFAEDDTHVALLVVNGSDEGERGRAITSQVFSRQITPTILKRFDLDPPGLQSVQEEGTLPVPR